MKGEWIPTRFNTGGVKVFFSVRSLGNRSLEHECDISGLHLCVYMTVNQNCCTTRVHHSAKSEGCIYVQVAGDNTANSFKAMAVFPLGFDLRLALRWKLVEFGQEPKLQQSPRFQPISRQTLGGKELTLWVVSLSSICTVRPRGQGSFHWQSWRNIACTPVTRNMRSFGNAHLKKIMCPLLIVGTQVVPKQEIKHRLNTRVLSAIWTCRISIQIFWSRPVKRQLSSSEIHSASRRKEEIKVGQLWNIINHNYLVSPLNPSCLPRASICHH